MHLCIGVSALTLLQLRPHNATLLCHICTFSVHFWHLKLRCYFTTTLFNTENREDGGVDDVNEPEQERIFCACPATVKLERGNAF